MKQKLLISFLLFCCSFLQGQGNWMGCAEFDIPADCVNATVLNSTYEFSIDGGAVHTIVYNGTSVISTPALPNWVNDSIGANGVVYIFGSYADQTGDILLCLTSIETSCGESSDRKSCKIFPLQPDPMVAVPTENCGNGTDDDGDGLIDCYDPDCASCVAGFDPCDCTNGLDLDNNGVNEYAQETVTVTAPNTGTWSIQSATNYFDSSGNALNTGSLTWNGTAWVFSNGYVPADGSTLYSMTLVHSGGQTITINGGSCSPCSATNTLSCANDAGVNGTSGTAYTFDLTQNDTYSCTGSITYAVSNVVGATVTVSSSGVATITGSTGTVSFDYTATCSTGGSCTASVSGTIASGCPASGTACNDNNVCTTGDIEDGNCNCAGTFQDADNDGICDANDNTNGNCALGGSCNDNNACTDNDVYDANCNCAGTANNTDADGDGTIDCQDSAPNDPCVPSNTVGNCDADGDGIVNSSDDCDNVSGITANNGCSCTDNVQNGTETAIDCGGGCPACPVADPRVTVSPCNNNGGSPNDYWFQTNIYSALGGGSYYTGLNVSGTLSLPAGFVIDYNAFGTAFFNNLVAAGGAYTVVGNNINWNIPSWGTQNLIGGYIYGSCPTCPAGSMTITNTVTSSTPTDTNNSNNTASCSTTSLNTCSDGIQNGNETGVDCGGSCGACVELTCTSSNISCYFGEAIRSSRGGSAGSGSNYGLTTSFSNLNLFFDVRVGSNDISTTTDFIADWGDGTIDTYPNIVSATHIDVSGGVNHNYTNNGYFDIKFKYVTDSGLEQVNTGGVFVAGGSITAYYLNETIYTLGIPAAINCNSYTASYSQIQFGTSENTATNFEEYCFGNHCFNPFSFGTTSLVDQGITTGVNRLSVSQDVTFPDGITRRITSYLEVFIECP